MAGIWHDLLQNGEDFSTVFPTHAVLSSALSLTVSLIPITWTTEASPVTTQPPQTTPPSQTTQQTTDANVTFSFDDVYNSTLNESLELTTELGTTESALTTQQMTTEAVPETVHIAVVIRACAVTGDASCNL